MDPVAIPNPTQCIPGLPQHITVHQLHLGAMPVHPSSSQCNPRHPGANASQLYSMHSIQHAPSASWCHPSAFQCHPSASHHRPSVSQCHSSASWCHPSSIPMISVLLQCIPVNQVHPGAMPVPSQCIPVHPVHLSAIPAHPSSTPVHSSTFSVHPNAS